MTFPYSMRARPYLTLAHRGKNVWLVRYEAGLFGKLDDNLRESYVKILGARSGASEFRHGESFSMALYETLRHTNVTISTTSVFSCLYAWRSRYQESDGADHGCIIITDDDVVVVWLGRPAFK